MQLSEGEGKGDDEEDTTPRHRLPVPVHEAERDEALLSERLTGTMLVPNPTKHGRKHRVSAVSWSKTPGSTSRPPLRRRWRPVPASRVTRLYLGNASSRISALLTLEVHFFIGEYAAKCSIANSRTGPGVGPNLTELRRGIRIAIVAKTGTCDVLVHALRQRGPSAWIVAKLSLSVMPGSSLGVGASRLSGQSLGYSPIWGSFLCQNSAYPRTSVEAGWSR